MYTSDAVRAAGAAGAAGRVSATAAQVYDQFFVPALFAQWVPRTLDSVAPKPGDDLLDIGTGTGAVARGALPRVGPTGSVVGLDPNGDMLTVAAAEAPGATLVQGCVEDIPFEDDEFDCVTCQFAVMFVTDRGRAVNEVVRVLRPGGRLAVSTWSSVEHSPGYAAMVDLLGAQIGAWAADALRAPFRLGTAGKLGALLRPRFPGVAIRQYDGVARFGSLDEWLHTDIRGWTLADHIDDDQFDRLRTHAVRRLGEFASTDGRVQFAAPALFATATAQ